MMVCAKEGKARSLDEVRSHPVRKKAARLTDPMRRFWSFWAGRILDGAAALARRQAKLWRVSS